jgi:hypothetical protein
VESTEKKGKKEGPSAVAQAQGAPKAGNIYKLEE